MSDSETRYNLLGLGAVKGYRIVPGYEWPGYAEPDNWTQRAACVPGKAYTLSIVTYVAGEVCFGFYLADGSLVRPKGYEKFAAGESVVRTLTAPEGAEYVAASWAGGNRRPMVVEGTEPAAWELAEGEELVGGGGAQMSANLWKAENVIPAENPKDGIYACSGMRSVRTNVALDRLSANQTFHCGFSVNPGADEEELNVALLYKDAEGSTNYAFTSDASATAGKWTRVGKSVVVPSGMTVYQMVICNHGNASGSSGWKVMNPTLSLGSPVCLASSAHTPYATQDHIAAEYSTKASQKILSDSITSEVKARAKTDGAVSELSSKMEQTVNGINVSLDKLTATERQIHSWFDFGSDASGNPKLSMGSSSSPIIGEYSNTGTAYKDRAGATLLALDAANSTTGADHMVAKDMTVGKWKWVPTNGGDNLTLVWIGG